MNPPRRKRFKKHNFDPEKCELPGSESEFDKFKSDSKVLRKADKIASKPTHYVCIPLAKLVPQYDTIAEEVAEFYKNEENPPNFSTGTRDRLHLTLLMITPKTKDEETTIEQTLKHVCETFSGKLESEIENRKRRQQQELQNKILKNTDTSFLLELDSLSAFHQGNLIYSTCSETPFWLTLFRKIIHDELSDKGIVVEDINERAYVPHVTMFRHKQNSDDCFESEVLLEHLDGFGLGNVFVDGIDFLRIGGDTRTSFKIELEVIGESCGIGGVKNSGGFDEPLATSFIRKYLRYARIIRRYCGL